MDYDYPQGQEEVLVGSTKRRPLEEVNQIEEENYHSNHHRTSIHSQEQIHQIQQEINYLNNQLTYLYISPFRHHQGCTHEHLTELCEITNALLARTEKIKDYKNDKARAEAENKRLRDQTERLNYMISDLQRTKGELKANLQLTKKECKAQLDKAQKERQSLAKDLASYHNKQEYAKHDLKKRDDKLQLIQSRLEKMAEKIDKKDYRNNFDLFQPLLRNTQDLTNLEKEAEAMILKSIGRQSEVLESENKQLKQCLKEIFLRLAKIHDNNIQDPSKKVNFETFLSFLQMPMEATRGVANTLNQLLDRIQRGLAQRSNFSAFVHNSNVDPSNLLNAIDKMKFYCSQAQSLDQKRSSFTSELFTIFDKKQKLNHTVLQKMSNSLKNSHENYRTNLTSTEELLNQEESQRNEYTVFLSNQISLMAHESQVMDILRRDMQHLFDNSNEGEQLL